MPRVETENYANLIILRLETSYGEWDESLWIMSTDEAAKAKFQELVDHYQPNSSIESDQAFGDGIEIKWRTPAIYES